MWLYWIRLYLLWPYLLCRYPWWIQRPPPRQFDCAVAGLKRGEVPPLLTASAPYYEYPHDGSPHYGYIYYYTD